MIGNTSFSVSESAFHRVEASAIEMAFPDFLPMTSLMKTVYPLIARGEGKLITLGFTAFAGFFAFLTTFFFCFLAFFVAAFFLAAGFFLATVFLIVAFRLVTVVAYEREAVSTRRAAEMGLACNGTVSVTR